MKALRVSTGIALLFLGPQHTRWGWGQPHAPAVCTPGKDLVPILQEAGWAPGLVWIGWKSRPYWDLIPDHPARSQSLYRLSYLAHKFNVYNVCNNINCSHNYWQLLHDPLYTACNYKSNTIGWSTEVTQHHSLCSATLTIIWLPWEGVVLVALLFDDMLMKLMEVFLLSLINFECKFPLIIRPRWRCVLVWKNVVNIEYCTPKWSFEQLMYWNWMTGWTQLPGWIGIQHAPNPHHMSHQPHITAQICITQIL